MSTPIALLFRAFAACLVVLVVGCSSPSEPQAEQEVFTVDPQTGNTKIDAVIFRARLQAFGSLPSDDAAEITEGQEYAEACNELVMQAIPLAGSLPFTTFVRGIEDDEESHEDAMQVALGLWGLNEAQRDSTVGVFSDAETDSAWDAYVGTDNAFTDVADALRGMYLVRCFAVREYKEALASVRSEGARYAITTLLRAATNHLISTIIACNANSIALPDTPDLSDTEVEDLRARSAAQNFFTPP